MTYIISIHTILWDLSIVVTLEETNTFLIRNKCVITRIKVISLKKTDTILSPKTLAALISDTL